MNTVKGYRNMSNSVLIETYDAKIERLNVKRNGRCRNCRYSVMDDYHGRICKCKEKLRDEGVNDFLYAEEVKSCKYKDKPDSWIGSGGSLRRALCQNSEYRII